MTEQPRGRRKVEASCCPICGTRPLKRRFGGRIDYEAAFEPCEHQRGAMEAEENAGYRGLEIEDRDLGASKPGYCLEGFCGAWEHKSGRR